MEFDKIWIETQRDGRIFACTMMLNGGGSAYTRILGQLDGGPAIGTRWDYVRTDCIDTKAGALAAAKAEIERLKAELTETKKAADALAGVQRNDKLQFELSAVQAGVKLLKSNLSESRDELQHAKAEIDRLKAELVEARKMPECVRELVDSAFDVQETRAAAVRRHYAPPIKLSIGEWRLTHGETCRVFSDGRQFLARLTGTMYAVRPDGQLDGRGVWLVERIGD